MTLLHSVTLVPDAEILLLSSQVLQHNYRRCMLPKNMGFSLHACTSFKVLHATQMPSVFVLIWPKVRAVCIAVE